MRLPCNPIVFLGLTLGIALPAYLSAQGNGNGNAALMQRVEALEAAVAQLEAALNAEVAARQAADTTVQTNVDNEAAARIAADAVLQQNVDAEAAARAAADTTLQNNINNIVPQALLDLANYVSVDPDRSTTSSVRTSSSPVPTSTSVTGSGRD